MVLPALTACVLIRKRGHRSPFGFTPAGAVSLFDE
jgi:hypothetical protein